MKPSRWTQQEEKTCPAKASDQSEPSVARTWATADAKRTQGAYEPHDGASKRIKSRELVPSYGVRAAPEHRGVTHARCRGLAGVREYGAGARVQQEPGRS